MSRGKVLLAVIWIMLLVPGPALAGEWKLARLSYSSGWDGLPAVVAIERGFFVPEDLVVSGLAVSSSQAVINSVVAGSTDFAAVPQRTLLVMAALNLPIKIVSMNAWGTEMELIVPKENTTGKSIADLKGKAIGVGVSSEAYPVLIRMMNKAKMRPADATIKSLSAEELTRAFQNKLADAVFESRHFTSVLVRNGQARVVLTPKDVVEALGLIGASPLVTRKELVEKDPATAQKFVNGWVKALKYIGQDPEDAARLLQIFFHRQGVTVTDELAKSWLAMNRYNRFFWSPADVADAEYNGWALQQGGILKVQPKLEGLVENRFAQQALLGLQQGGRPGTSEQAAPAAR